MQVKPARVHISMYIKDKTQRASLRRGRSEPGVCVVSEEEEKQQGQENGKLKLLMVKEVRRQGKSAGLAGGMED